MPHYIRHPHKARGCHISELLRYNPNYNILVSTKNFSLKLDWTSYYGLHQTHKNLWERTSVRWNISSFEIIAEQHRHWGF